MNQLRTLFLSLLILSFSNAVFASQKDLIYEFQQGWDEDYHSLTCSDNMKRLYERIINSGIEFKNAHIIHITHKHVPYSSIYGLNQRTIVGENSYKPLKWVFHAVLLVDDNILDFDYMNEPSIISFKDYMNSMWDQGDLINSYQFQIKPGYLYEKSDLDGTMNNQDYLSFKELKEYIKKRPSEEGLYF